MWPEDSPFGQGSDQEFGQGSDQEFGQGGDQESGQGSDQNYTPDEPSASPTLTPPRRAVVASDATAIAAGYEHACALLGGGTVKCWGSNDSGQLGDGTTTNRPTPVAVSGVSGATAIAAGSFHTCALLGGSTVKCWGWGLYVG